MIETLKVMDELHKRRKGINEAIQQLEQHVSQTKELRGILNAE